MSIKPSHYEALLADYSNQVGAIALLKQHRPYLELIPSLRRPDESIITLPLPVVRLQNSSTSAKTIGVINAARDATCLPCDVAILMCDPEWKIKTGVEILVFIHRPQEDFSDLLSRWRQTQVWLDKGYEWLLPPRYKHILADGAEIVHPLFVVFPETPERVKRGLQGAYLPFVIQSFYSLTDEELPEVVPTESP